MGNADLYTIKVSTSLPQNKKPYVKRRAFCDSAAIRTRDPQLRRLLLYPTELRNLSLCRSGCKDIEKSKTSKRFSPKVA